MLHNNNTKDLFKGITKYWWISLLVGILSIILGLFSLKNPLETIFTLNAIFITVLFLSGVMDIVFSVSNSSLYPGWGWTMVAGIMDILLAGLLVILPADILAVVTVTLFGFWILFRSIWTIGLACEMMRYVRSGWLLALGILVLIFSIIYLLSPVFGKISALTGMISVAFIAYGVFRIYYSLKVRKINQSLQ